jgi:hypothetical protein
MYPVDEYTLWKDYKLNKEPAVAAAADQHRMLRDAGLIRRPWLTCQICRSLWLLGHALARAGQWLERRYAPVALQPRIGLGT